MEKHTILQNNDNMYWGYDFEPFNTTDVNNKLFATFTSLQDLDILINSLNQFLVHLSRLHHLI
jgi:hypothetical protein